MHYLPSALTEMDRPTFAFGTDFHGNLRNIDRFLHTAHAENTDHVIFGGDLTPKKMAVRFTNGQGLTVEPESPHQMANSELRSASDLYENGYMLFDAPSSGTEVKQMDSIVRALEKQMGTRKDPEWTVFDENDLQFAKEKLLPMIAAFLKETTEGKRIFALYIRNFQLQNARSPLPGPDDVVQALWFQWGISMLGSKNRYNDLPTRNRLLFGRTRVAQEKFRAAELNAIRLTMVGVSTILRSAFANVMPWVEWIAKNHELDKHGLPGQRQFLRDFFLRLQEFRQTFRGSVSLILGNDDLAPVLDDVRDASREGLFTDATNRVVQLSQDVQMLGYGCTPPAGLGNHYNAWFRSEDEIAADLKTLSQQLRSDVRYTIANIHCPPAKTDVSVGIVEGKKKTDFGSTGVRSFIEQVQPTVTLTGHVHKAWMITGKTRVKLGKTFVYNPGDSEEAPPRILLGSLKNHSDGRITS